MSLHVRGAHAREVKINPDINSHFSVLMKTSDDGVFMNTQKFPNIQDPNPLSAKKARTPALTRTPKTAPIMSKTPKSAPSSAKAPKIGPASATAPRNVAK